jgi:hypothetical protein
LIAPLFAIAQKSSDLTFKDLKKVNCEGVDENCSEKMQLQCLLIDVVNDGINYSPLKTRKTAKAITSPEMAWEELIRLYPEFEKNEINCWTEYNGYYVFSMDCGMSKKPGTCAFVCVLYVPIGGDEFWFFVPRT